MNIFLSPSKIYWSSKDTRSLLKFYYYIYYRPHTSLKGKKKEKEKVVVMSMMRG